MWVVDIINVYRTNVRIATVFEFGGLFVTAIATALTPSASMRIVIIGGGVIGASMATVCADNGFSVDLVEPDAKRRRAIAEGVQGRFEAMQQAGLSNGTAAAALVRIKLHSRLEDVPRDVAMVIEAGPEVLAIKRAIFADLLAWAGPETILASTSSALAISQIIEQPEQRKNCICTHSVNPPTVIRLVECVPSAQTDEAIVERALVLLRSAGFTPVRLGREINGFVFNRLQGAILREAYRLVSDGVIDVKGLDLLFTEGLGPRWALSGPFETAELNTPGGIKGHASRMGPSYKAMGEERGERDCEWTRELVDEVDRQRRAIVKLDDLPKRRAWRELALSRLIAARRSNLQSWDNRTGGAEKP